MLKISKKTEYAIIALVDMADHDHKNLVTVKDISRRYNIPKEILGKVMQRLAKNDLIESHKGINGGYQLRIPLNQINIKQVIESVEGPIKLVDCTMIEGHNCSQISYCNIKSPMEYIQSELAKFFNSITLQQVRSKHQNISSHLEIKTSVEYDG